MLTDYWLLKKDLSRIRPLGLFFHH